MVLGTSSGSTYYAMDYAMDDISSTVFFLLCMLYGVTMNLVLSCVRLLYGCDP